MNNFLELPNVGLKCERRVRYSCARDRHGVPHAETTVEQVTPDNIARMNLKNDDQWSAVATYNEGIFGKKKRKETFR